MAGVDRIQTRLNKLLKIMVPPKKIVGVVFMNKDGSVDWPENCSPQGVLLVPYCDITAEEWEQSNLEEDRQRNDSKNS